MAKVTPPKQKTNNKAEKPKTKKKKRERYKLKLTGWLKTPADWAKFDAWAKLNALPRKIPEPEPVTRTSKPLWKMRKRIEMLSKPVKKPDPSLQYRLDQSVSKKALKAKASKRIKIIAKPVIKPIVMPRVFPVKINKSTLNYEATENIIKISKPKDFRTEECKNLAETLQMMEMDMEKMHDEERGKHQKQLWMIIKKALACPDVLSAEQVRQLITEGGVYRTAFAYELTPWMKFLSLPSYRFLRIRKDDTAKEWKEYYLNEMETRGKRALEEQIQREEKRRKLEEEAIADDANKLDEETTDDQPQLERLEPKADGEDDVTNGIDEKEAADGPKPENNEEEQNPVADENKDVDGEPVNVDSEPVTPVEQADNEEKPMAKEKSKIKSEAKPNKTRLIPRPTPVADNEDTKKKRAERNAWRFAPPPWKDGDPLKVKESALKGPVSPRMDELAKPHIHKDTISRKNPFDVKKSALTSPVPARMTELAKPARAHEPVERSPPRKKNKYRQPIFPIPPYGKKLPRVPPYKERDCKPADEGSPEEPSDLEKPEEKPDPIVFKPTIDPYFDPEGAQRQLNARNALAMTDKKEEMN